MTSQVTPNKPMESLRLLLSLLERIRMKRSAMQRGCNAVSDAIDMDLPYSEVERLRKLFKSRQEEWEHTRLGIEDWFDDEERSDALLEYLRSSLCT